MERRFHDRFRGLVRAHGIYTIAKHDAAKNKVIGRAKTVAEPVTVDVWADHLAGRVGLGIVPIDDNAQSRFGAIDVDIYDLDFKAVENSIRKLSFPLILCRTKSGGVHLYLFTSEPVSAKLIRDKLMEFAVALGFPGVEIFPKQIQLANDDDTGNWINVPYFNVAKTDRWAFYKGKQLSAEKFLDLADKIAVDAAALEKINAPGNGLLDGGPPCLQHLARAGFPEGTRNNGLFNLGVYCRLYFGDDWETELDKMNREYMAPPLSSNETQTIIKSLKRKKYFYKCNDQPISSVCNRAICLNRKHGVGGNADDPGVVFGGLVKLDTRPPTWIVDVNGIRVELNDTADLIAQDRFRVLCIERLNILPNKVTAKSWEKIVQQMLERLEIVDAPDDAGPIGQFMSLVETFTSERGMAKDRDELILGKPWLNRGRVYFRSADLLRYLEQQRFYEIRNARRAWAILREHGAEHGQFQIKGKCVRVWHIPEFKQIEGELDAPRPDVKGDDF